jgi:hypothetical protein
LPFSCPAPSQYSTCRSERIPRRSSAPRKA